MNRGPLSPLTRNYHRLQFIPKECLLDKVRQNQETILFFFFFFIFGKILCRCDKNISINRTSNTDTTELNLNSHRLLEEIFAFYYSRRVSLIEIHYLVSIEMKRPYERPGKSRTRGSTTIYDERD